MAQANDQWTGEPDWCAMDKESWQLWWSVGASLAGSGAILGPILIATRHHSAWHPTKRDQIIAVLVSVLCFFGLLYCAWKLYTGPPPDAKRQDPYRVQQVSPRQQPRTSASAPDHGARRSPGGQQMGQQQGRTSRGSPRQHAVV